ncbi:MAG: hypothetical protein EPO51_20805 [Phenylobacterium sp.]|uniref:hypothetical protein n=1 Tax=Phenylobacterium sp. TaxID=1871053 RepID=UPI0011FDF981|nr:hypothetical protein [Phenylobacterium sp.]TAJ69964.1 MAG: hypothetical protein EPO51_20805 [Phenylobacterium sp.]
MSLANDLARTRTEEDVKDAYIKALGLKSYFKGLVDIQTEEVWFEAKDAPTSPIVMFGQLLVYVRAAKKRGEAIPAFLAVIDREKAAIVPTERALPLLDDKSIVWPKSGSGAGRQLAAQIAPYVQTHIVEYEIAHDEAAFINAVKDAIRERRIIRTPITPDNLRQVFDRWVEMVGSELGMVNPTDYAVLFFADIMHDGHNEAMTNLPARLLFSGEKPVFLLNGQQYELASQRGYRNFWAIYHRPPEAEYRHYLLERRDSLLPIDEQKFKGAYYTPLHIVDKAYDELKATLGSNWQNRYIVWDMCAGVGNLEAKHSNLRNVYMSTLDQADVTIMKSNTAFSGAEIFQYDYLNDDITDFGEIDYDRSNKLPPALRKAIADANAGIKDAKPILILINPPYAEAMNVENRMEAGSNASLKKGVASTRISHSMTGLGYASRELFVQFLYRIMLELPSSKIAMFSKLKYVNAPNFEEFRRRWTAKYLDGFVVHSRVFDGLKGDFPIGFLIWDLAKNSPAQRIDTIALNRAGDVIAEKAFYRELPRPPLAEWITRPRSNRQPALPLNNALTPTRRTNDVRGRYWADGAIGSMICKGNDFQNAANATALLSSGYNSAGAFFVTRQNLWQAAIVFTVRRLIKPTWLNDRDQFLQPSQPLSDEFKSDCLIWMLFNGSNLAAGADGLRWNGRDWSLVNHFIPFTEVEVGASGRFESDFMAHHMAGMTFSPEAKAVLHEGRTLFRRFHGTQFPRKIRDEFKLGRPDAGWYQVRRALEAYSDTELTDFEPMKAAYSALSEKLRPMVYSLGFLPE